MTGTLKMPHEDPPVSSVTPAIPDRNLRAAAEARLADTPPTDLATNPAPRVQYELQVHQIELEMQNEALRQAQGLLQESRDHFADLYEFAPVGYVNLTPEGLISQINLTGVALLRAERRKLINRSFRASVLTPYQDRWTQYFIGMKSGTAPAQLEVQMQRGDGSLFEALLNGAAKTNQDNQADLRITITDITAKKQAEAELRIAATAFESQQGITITNAQKVILRVNKSFCQITGYSAREAVGQTPRLLQSGRHDASFYENLWRSVVTLGSWQGEIWNRRKNGEVYPERLSISAVKDPDGVITNYVGIFTDITAYKAAEKEIERLAYHDALTHLPNRRLLLDRLQQSLVATKRQEQRAAVFFIDLDHFKNINDTRGHAEGDSVLLQVAQRITSCVREGDTVARLGGDEFVAVLQNLDAERIDAASQARLVGEKILTTLTQPYQLPSGACHCSASIGIALFGHKDEETAEAPLKRADLAMYHAKEAGGNQLRFFDAQAEMQVALRNALEADLRQALEKGQFVLHYQPQVSLSTGVLTGVEALIRWQRVDGQLVPPNDFIPAAERTKLIVPLGRWVITEACRQIRAWLDAGLPEIKVAVNVSAHQFLAGDLDAILTRALAVHSVAPHLLEIELTESVLMEDPAAAVIMINRIKATGVGLALDDFGTGYSSLAYLGQFPFDLLKIDRSFVQSMVTEPSAATIAMTIIDLAHRMHMMVVAEGVETEAQLSFLRKNKCDQMQGFLFSRPLAEPAARALMQERKTLLQFQDAEQNQKNLLVVDDEPSITSAIHRLLRHEGYRILVAESGLQALELLALNEVQVLLSDQLMPGMNGTELMRRARVISPNTVRLILSGYTDLKTVTDAVNKGFIYKFLTKPWENDELKANIRDAFRHSAVQMLSSRPTAAK
jgi:diguanylate cyclase (GGDEF)-like protein/PAS domain S-box-containing protein